MTETHDNSVETNEKIVEFKFNKDAVLPAIKRNSKKLIAGAAVFAAGTALTLMAFRSVPDTDEPEELEHDDLDDIGFAKENIWNSDSGLVYTAYSC